METFLWIIFGCCMLIGIIINLMFVEMRRILREEKFKVNFFILFAFPYQPFCELLQQNNLMYNNKGKCIQLYKVVKWLMQIAYVGIILFIIVVIIDVCRS
jgi:hypothetical protein